ncbi:MAG TPA: ATP-binding cassette domain-containing protein [Acidobacteriaceae bacterium]|jgi:phospholipid/cholesterol/gamma-HCH transport system ATP-binding protein|nr:ATP-binding cassette domain-containing protein [Acidobacteriaceae bacterium]
MVTSPQAEAMPAHEAPGEPVIVFDDVSIGFEGNPVLDHVSFTVISGETRILLGPAGGGKSVLLKLANGLMRPDSGKITVFGQVLNDMPERDLFELRKRIGMVFQEGALFDSLTVRDNVAYQLMEQHVPEQETTERVTEALRFVELEQTLDKFPSELSGGMRRRVAIARAIVSRPDLILYDSPTGGLDPITSTLIIELVMKQRDVYGTTSVVVTHRLQDAFVLATHSFDREKNHMIPLPEGKTNANTSFLVLNEGRLIFDGSTHDLVHSDDPFLKEFLS